MPNPTPFMSFKDHITLLNIRHFQQIHIRYSIQLINVKNASEATVHKDLLVIFHDIAFKYAYFKAVWE